MHVGATVGDHSLWRWMANTVLQAWSALAMAVAWRACTESTLRWPTTGTGLTQRLIRTEEESFAIRGNLPVIYN